MASLEEIRRQLEAAVVDARRVGDSPLRADQLADRLAVLSSLVAELTLSEYVRDRIATALADAERALRRDDDGVEAARQIQAALRAAEPKTPKPSPFRDD